MLDDISAKPETLRSDLVKMGGCGPLLAFPFASGKGF